MAPTAIRQPAWKPLGGAGNTIGHGQVCFRIGTDHRGGRLPGEVEFGADQRELDLAFDRNEIVRDAERMRSNLRGGLSQAMPMAHPVIATKLGPRFAGTNGNGHSALLLSFTFSEST